MIYADQDNSNITVNEALKMKPVVQEEISGCAIASAAAIAGISYAKAKRVANSIGVYANDSALWSETDAIRRLLDQLGIQVDNKTIPFSGWNTLPNCALLSIKWHLEKNKPYWHWVVFVREDGQESVLDSKKTLKTNIRKDFGRMKPKWFIEVKI